MTLFLCSLGHIWVGQSSLFLFWVVNWIYLLCCMALLMVLTQSNSFHPVQQPLSNIIVQHSLLHYMHHMFANDTELYNSTHCSITDSLVCNIQNCVSNVKKKEKRKKSGPPTTGWMKLNKNKTEALLFDLFKSSDLLDLCVSFDDWLTMKLQVDMICQTAYFEIWRIGSIYQSLTTEATKASHVWCTPLFR